MQPWDDQQSSRTRFAVSPETYIAWHTDVSPAFPFHPVPILRELSDAEMFDLTRHVERLGDLPPAESAIHLACRPTWLDLPRAGGDEYTRDLHPADSLIFRSHEGLSHAAGRLLRVV